MLIILLLFIILWFQFFILFFQDLFLGLGLLFFGSKLGQRFSLICLWKRSFKFQHRFFWIKLCRAHLSLRIYNFKKLQEQEQKIKLSNFYKYYRKAQKSIYLLQYLGLYFYFFVLLIQQKFANFLTSKVISTQMSSYEPVKKIITDLKSMKCTRKGCLSDQRDTLQIAWFGNQYENKEMTCSSCYILDNEAIKKSLPSNLNVLPLLHFTDKFMNQFKKYQQKKSTAAFAPKIVKEKQAQLDAQNNKTEIRLLDVLKGLEMALETFTKKISAQNKNIFTNKIFQEIISMNNENKFQGLLQKILLLIQGLNFSDLSNAYEFQNLQVRQKKVKKLRQKIKQVQERTIKVLTGLYEDLKTKNETISKI